MKYDLIKANPTVKQAQRAIWEAKQRVNKEK